MTTTPRTELSDRVQVGDIIRPFRGRNEDGTPYVPSHFGKLRMPHDTSVAYVVEEARMDGGGTGHGEIYPDGWHVTARRLAKDGTYDPSGAAISFYQSGSFIDTIVRVPVIGRMRRTFVREDA